MQPNIDAPTGDADHVVLRALPVSQLRPTAASPSPCGATLNGLSWGRSDLDRSSSNAWPALDLLSPIEDRQGPRGFVLSVPDAVTVRLISWTLKELWNNQSASAIPTKSRNTSRSLRSAQWPVVMDTTCLSSCLWSLSGIPASSPCLTATCSS